MTGAPRHSALHPVIPLTPAAVTDAAPVRPLPHYCGGSGWGCHQPEAQLPAPPPLPAEMPPSA
jgi:hypothetical protein